jgi:hypothetical protein
MLVGVVEVGIGLELGRLDIAFQVDTVFVVDMMDMPAVVDIELVVGKAVEE